MPLQLKILLGLMGGGLLLAAADLNGMAVATYMFVIVGIVRGSETIRSFMIWGGFRYYIIFSLMLAALVIATGRAAELPFMLLELAYFVYVIWCLRHPEVQQWMLNKSLNFDAEELPAS
jgi:hypothetical protein